VNLETYYKLITNSVGLVYFFLIESPIFTKIIKIGLKNSILPFMLFKVAVF